MTTHITTIFDKNYLVRALAFRKSLQIHAPNALVYMLCLDEESYLTLQTLNLTHTTLLQVSDLNDHELLSAKENRTLPEFASTVKPALLLHMLHSDQVKTTDLLSFIDPDILFYSSADKLFDDIYASGSITITPHRFAQHREHEQYKKGVYNAGMVFFRKDENALTCLTEWRKQCIDWCYIRYEDGKIGDQGYLSNWHLIYKNVNILTHKGVNLGSWNIENYTITKKGSADFIDSDILICYHFHGLKIYLNSKDIVKAYPITILHDSIYKTYIEELNKAYGEIKKIKSPWTYGFVKNPGILRLLKQTILGYFR